MKRTYIFDTQKKRFVEKVRSTSGGLVMVQGDISEYGGRAKFREHLKRTGTVELGHSDIKAQTEKWQSKKSSFQDRMRHAEKHQVREAAPPSGEIRDYDRSRIASEVANRLDGRPTPDRKMLIKLTLETAKEIARRR